MADQKIVKIHQLLNLLRFVYKAFEKEWAEEAKACGLTIPQQHILWLVYFDEGCSISDLSYRGFWHMSTLTDLLNRMEKEGYIRKVRDECDKRTTRVYLTDKGRKKREETERIAPDYFSMLKKLDTLDPGYFDMVISHLYRICNEVFDGKAFTKFVKHTTEKLKNQ